MDCHKAKELIPFYLAPHESWLDPQDKPELVAHLAMCESCWKEYEETRRVVRFYQKHGQISEETQGLIDKASQAEQKQAKERPKTIELSQITIRIAAIAAAIAICIGIWLLSQTQNDSKAEKVVKHVLSSIQEINPTVKVTENGVAMSTTDPITTGSQIREFLINSKHRLVMDKNTKLSIRSLDQNGKSGSLVELYKGQILAHVEHDGNPFEVHSPHGKAIIVGTTFDIKVTDHEMNLVVAEGSVRFESPQGSVEVDGGYRSTVTTQAIPTGPAACNPQSLMAWAKGSDILTSLAGSLFDPQLTKQLTDLADELPLSYPEPPLDLNSLDYDSWVAEKRDWFKGQFPWIFLLHDELIKKGIDVSYPELLIQTGDIWQIVYPQHFYKQIPIIQRDNLLKIVNVYQLNSIELDQIINATRSTNLSTLQMSFDQGALNQWLSLVRAVERSCDNIDKLNELRDYSVDISEYLENTRTLLWFGVHNDLIQIPIQHKQEFLSMLKHQALSANECKASVWSMNMSKSDICLKCDEFLQRLTESIEIFKECELRITECRLSIEPTQSVPRAGLQKITK